MKMRVLALLFGLVAAVAWTQVRIVSIDRDGTVKWTNLVTTSAVYRVDWAMSPEGTWRPLTVITNQTRVATSNLLTGQSSAFFRVAWTNATRLSEFSAYDMDGSLIATGWMNGGGCPPFSGTWMIQRAGDPTNRTWPAIALGNGCYSGNLSSRASLNPYTADGGVLLESNGGLIIGSNSITITGIWQEVTIGGTEPGGAFNIFRRGTF